MNDRDKEQVLHKVIASSVFLFALCALPITQHYLTAPSGETGQVQGASTDTSVTKADITPEDCQAQKEKGLADLDRFLTGKKIAMERDYNANVKPYQDALAVLQGDEKSTQSETQALNGLIDSEHESYLTKLSQVQDAVDSQKKDIDSRLCEAE